MTLQVEQSHRPVTLVWLDAEEAILLVDDTPIHEGADPPPVRRVRSQVPPRRRASAGDHRNRRARSGGGGDPDDLVERRREHLLVAYLREVSSLIPATHRVVLMGPGQVHGRLAHELRVADTRHGRSRPVEDAAAGPMTERQLRARWRELDGRAPERRLPANAGGHA